MRGVGWEWGVVAELSWCQDALVSDGLGGEWPGGLRVGMT